MKEPKPDDNEMEWYALPLILLLQVAMGPILLWLGPHIPSMK